MKPSHSHCPECGTELPETDWPRECDVCGSTHFLNPTPVAVLVQPVEDGVLTVRRNIPPHEGELALPGGFIELDESWEQAAARETYEETGIEVDADAVEVFDVHSAPDGTVLIFGIAPPHPRAVLDDADLSGEASELVVVDDVRELAFPIHTEVLTDWLLES